MTFRWIEQKREYRRYKARVAALPESHRTAVHGLERYMTAEDGPGAVQLLRSLDEDLFR